MRRILILIACSLYCLSLSASDPRAIILIVGDGFDDQHVTMGRNYLAGMNGKLHLDSMAFRGSVQIETLSPQGQPVYVADSANTATALATGIVTSIGRISTNIKDEDLTTIAEKSIRSGLRVGLVTTSSLTDATPAAFLTHVSVRSCEGPQEVMGTFYYGVEQPACLPDSRENGGAGSIAEQLVDSQAYVLLGGGSKFFSQQTVDGEAVFQRAARQGFQIVTSKSQLNDVDLNSPLLGTFDDETLEVRWQGEGGRSAESAVKSWSHALSDYLGKVEQPEPMYCQPNPEYGETPSMAEMTQTALNLLEYNNKRGFFLMVESASIDKQSHSRNPCGSIGEIAQLEEVLLIALEYAARQPDTLVIVTADHAQAAQIVPEPSLYHRNPFPTYSPGLVARIHTPEGGLMRINYATNNLFSEEHTGANVPIFSNDVGREWLRPFMRQREIHDAMLGFLLGPDNVQYKPGTSQ